MENRKTEARVPHLREHVQRAPPARRRPRGQADHVTSFSPLETLALDEICTITELDETDEGGGYQEWRKVMRRPIPLTDSTIWPLGKVVSCPLPSSTLEPRGIYLPLEWRSREHRRQYGAPANATATARPAAA